MSCIALTPAGDIQAAQSNIRFPPIADIPAVKRAFRMR
jgi:hypothetical protein